MSDHEPPTSLDKPPPGDDHAGIPTRVAKLEVRVDELILRLDRLETKVDRMDQKIDAGLQKLNDRFDRFYYLQTALIAGLLGLLAKVLGVF